MGLIKCFGLFCLAMLLISVPGYSQNKTKPNIIIILTDDQRYDTLEYMPKLKTLLIDQGATFTNALVTTPLCCPSRASILTGQYAHNHGVEQNDREFAEKLNDRQTLAVWLKEAGYETTLIGKYLNGYKFDYIPPGWDNFHAFGKKSYYNFKFTNFVKGVHGPALTFPEGSYSTDIIASTVSDVIKRAETDDEKKPFFIYVAPNAPHEPAKPAQRHAEMLADLPPYRPPSFNEEDMTDKAFWWRKWWSKANEPLHGKRLNKIDKLRVEMLRSLLAVDDAIETIVNTLKDAGELENTVIIFTSDNGFHWGEHRLTDKRTPYEESIRVPFVYFDGRDRTKRYVDHLVANIDIAPTILDLADANIPEFVDGISMKSLAGGGAAVREYLLVQNFFKTYRSQHTAYRAIRGTGATYIQWEGWLWGMEEEYYDLTKDPYQLENVAMKPEYATDIEKMRAAFERLKGCAGVSCRAN